MTSARRTRIAIIDDSDAVRLSLALMLRAKGFLVDTFDSGADYLAAGANAAADCLLIDLRMPQLDGEALLQRIRDAGMSTPAIMITGDVRSDLSRRARDAGFAGFLRKPMTRSALIDAIGDATA